MEKAGILRMFARQEADFPICSSPVVNVTLDLMKLTGCYYPDALRDPLGMARLAEAAYTILGFEGIRIPFDLCIEGEAMGCRVKPAGEDSPSSILGPAYEDPDRISIPEDVFSRGRFPAVFEAAGRLKERYESKIPIYGGIVGPFSLAGHLISANKFLRFIIKNPQRVVQILEVISDFTIEYANRLLKAGCDIIAIIDPTASGDLIGEKVFNTFMVPIYQKMRRGIKGPTLLHICGNTNRFLPGIATTGIEGFSFEGPAVQVRKAREILGDKMLLIGNVPTQTLLLGTPDEVRKECLLALEEKVDLLAPSCGIPLKAPLANLRVMVDVVRERIERASGMKGIN